MELILISDSKLKIMLTKQDVLRHSIDPEKFDYADEPTRNAFRSILDEAYRLTGFDISENRLYIQIFPSKNGGCEFFVTRLESDENETISQKKQEKPKQELKIYEFSKFDDLGNICAFLRKKGYENKSSLYRDKQKNTYYLTVFIIQNQKKKKRPQIFSFISEYSEKEYGEIFMPYLCEYADLICKDDAVEKISEIYKR